MRIQESRQLLLTKGPPLSNPNQNFQEKQICHLFLSWHYLYFGSEPVFIRGSACIQQTIPTCDIFLIAVILSSVIQCSMIHTEMMSLNCVIKFSNKKVFDILMFTVVSVYQLMFYHFHAYYCRFKNTEGDIDNDHDDNDDDDYHDYH